MASDICLFLRERKLILPRPGLLFLINSKVFFLICTVPKDYIPQHLFSQLWNTSWKKNSPMDPTGGKDTTSYHTTNRPSTTELLPTPKLIINYTLFHEIVKTFFANIISLPVHRNKRKSVLEITKNVQF